jgi:hypothetical protein
MTRLTTDTPDDAPEAKESEPPSSKSLVRVDHESGGYDAVVPRATGWLHRAPGDLSNTATLMPHDQQVVYFRRRPLRRRQSIRRGES